MSAEVLREAARLMRERAEAASPGPWVSIPAGNYGPTGEARGRDIMGPAPVCPSTVAHVQPWGGVADADHVASWHPDVALAVADWLDAVAARMETRPVKHTHRALAVARAYLNTAEVSA